MHHPELLIPTMILRLIYRTICLLNDSVSGVTITISTIAESSENLEFYGFCGFCGFIWDSVDFSDFADFADFRWIFWIAKSQNPPFPPWYTDFIILDFCALTDTSLYFISTSSVQSFSLILSKFFCHTLF